MAEQAIQLFLKAIVLEIGGEFPKTHSIRELFAMIGFLTGKELKYDRESLAFLEGAYFNSRYLKFDYNKEDAENAIEITEEVIKIVEFLLFLAIILLNHILLVLKILSIYLQDNRHLPLERLPNLELQYLEESQKTSFSEPQL